MSHTLGSAHTAKGHRTSLMNKLLDSLCQGHPLILFFSEFICTQEITLPFVGEPGFASANPRPPVLFYTEGIPLQALDQDGRTHTTACTQRCYAVLLTSPAQLIHQ